MGSALLTAHDFAFESLEGGALPLSQFKGKTLLIVNTASRCSFTVQYGPLRELHNKYADKGFSVIAVPSNDFNQEPDDNAKIARVCKESWLVNFPMTAKTSIKGPEAHPFFTWAAENGGLFASPKWNFQKYLIAPNGTLVNWYLPSTSPLAGRVIRKIEQQLA